MIGLNFKLISNTDIKYDSQQCKISTIRGIDIEGIKKNKSICLPPLEIPKIETTEYVPESQKMVELWSKKFIL